MVCPREKQMGAGEVEVGERTGKQAAGFSKGSPGPSRLCKEQPSRQQWRRSQETRIGQHLSDARVCLPCRGNSASISPALWRGVTDATHSDPGR